MKSKLIITEKPSVANDIAMALGIKNKNNGYFEGSYQGTIYKISWCIGHLLAESMPEDYDEKYKKWNREDLPFIPKDWIYKVPKDKIKHVSILKNLINCPDVEEIVNACDAGREGELIFRNIYYYAKANKPMKRLWLSSLETNAILEGIDNLNDGEDYNNLYKAAVCRARADYLIGINATRLFSINYGNGQALKIGRVKTPTLFLIVDRENNIKNFIPAHFYIPQILYNGTVFSGGKFTNLNEVKELLESINSHSIYVKNIETKKKSEKSKKLYDLTSLQRDANKYNGYTANQVLEAAQSLYEKKLATYPRTDSKYITNDMAHSIEPLLTKISSFFGQKDTSSINNLKNIVNNKQVKDHHAILPTMSISSENIKKLPQIESDILLLICRRFVLALCDDYIYNENIIILECNGSEFTAKNKETLQIGYKVLDHKENIENKKNETDSTGDFNIYLEKGETISKYNLKVHEGITSPPKSYTEDTLLSAMERAGKEDLIYDDIERVGIGTAATRANIIEELIKGNLIERNKKSLVATKLGSFLCSIAPVELKSPKLTADWKTCLKKWKQVS